MSELIDLVSPDEARKRALAKGKHGSRDKGVVDLVDFDDEDIVMLEPRTTRKRHRSDGQGADSHQDASYVERHSSSGRAFGSTARALPDDAAAPSTSGHRQQYAAGEAPQGSFGTTSRPSRRRSDSTQAPAACHGLLRSNNTTASRCRHSPYDSSHAGPSRHTSVHTAGAGSGAGSAAAQASAAGASLPSADDLAVAKRLQQEEDAWAARALEQEARLQARMDQLIALEERMALQDELLLQQAAPRRQRTSSHYRVPAAALAEHNAGLSAAAAAAAAAMPPPPLMPHAGGAGSWGGLSALMQWGDPRLVLGGWRSGGRGRRGDAGAALTSSLPRQLQAYKEAVAGMARTGLPPHLLFSDRDFSAEDYELLCRLDETVESRKGMRAADIQRMPTQVVGAGACASPSDDGAAPSCCSICLEEYGAGQVARTLPCRHRFHRDCIDRWLKAKACCPICQRQLDRQQ